MPIDMSAAKAPPKKANPGTTRRATPAVKAAPETQSLNERRTQGLMGLASLGQGLCLMMGQYADAAAIGQLFSPVAKELSNVADTSDLIAKPIDFLIEVGPYGALIAAVTPLALQFMANHGAIDANRLSGQGVVPPAVLESQMKAQVAQMQTQALMQQKSAMREAAEAQKQFEEMMAEQMAEANKAA